MPSLPIECSFPSMPSSSPRHVFVGGFPVKFFVKCQKRWTSGVVSYPHHVNYRMHGVINLQLGREIGGKEKCTWGLAPWSHPKVSQEWVLWCGLNCVRILFSLKKMGSSIPKGKTSNYVPLGIWKPEFLVESPLLLSIFSYFPASHADQRDVWHPIGLDCVSPPRSEHCDPSCSPIEGPSSTMPEHVVVGGQEWGVEKNLPKSQPWRKKDVHLAFVHS